MVIQLSEPSEVHEGNIWPWMGSLSSLSTTVRSDTVLKLSQGTLSFSSDFSVTHRIKSFPENLEPKMACTWDLGGFETIYTHIMSSWRHGTQAKT